uniref:Globin family profile domain-containing protein n=1 Tax=Panagrolaimus sp. PS1159 TaxID=55785 RepID=A0AC35GF28_9BILA
MPTAASQAFAFVANIFGASTSTAQISTELTAHNGKQIGENELTAHNGKQIGENGNNKTTAGIITEQPKSGNHQKTSQIKPIMAPTGKPSITDSRESSDEFTDDSILTWEPDVDEKELVKKTWSDDFDFLYELGSDDFEFLYELGAAIYTYIFETNPNTKSLFPSIHQYGDRWKESKEFRQQALRFVQTLSHTVKNLYHMDRLAPYLYKIGELHVKFAKRGFQPEFWNDFLDAMEVSLADSIKRNKDLTDEQKKEATRVWRRLALYVITQMKRGYNDLLKKTEAA